ncbi:tetraspanin-6-like [Zingiber officinale]|uniref:tetraspanin-6-like n=1 Tax=Zingiber officinale TaxID=94328 RepID=UPI001C4C3BE7|nr:tetraspanin-6-like [Zingiber officinale]
MTMYRLSNTVIGYLNLVTLLASIPIIGSGLWLGRSSSTCDSFLQTPLLVVGSVVLLVSLAGLVGACFNVAWALWLYLLVMLFLVVALLGIIVFGIAVTGRGGEVPVPGRVYHEYRLGRYTGWLRHKITAPRYWNAGIACVVASRTCSKIAHWTPSDYLQRDLTPIQSGCCKPPTSCIYAAGAAVASQDEDCYRWNNAANVLCYTCDSCKAGVLEQVRRDWHKLSILNVVVLVVLIVVYSVGCCAFRNARRDELEYGYGNNSMPKVQPPWEYDWWRRWRDRRPVF